MPRDYSSYSFLTITVRDGIALVLIDHPERMNACQGNDHAEFARSLRDFALDDDVRVVILSGVGKAFSLGGTYDGVERHNQHPEELPDLQREARDLVYAHVDLEKPVITALNGYCTGAGAAYALLADFIIAERHVRFADGHVAIGLAAGDGGVMTWPISMGLVRAKKYLLTGDWITAEEAERAGLISEVVETGESLERAKALATRLSNGPQTAIRHTKKALNQWLRQAAITAFDYSLAMEMQTFTTREVAEAVRSLRAKGPGAIDRDWEWRR
jgi:enoyl-CoA hydratase